MGGTVTLTTVRRRFIVASTRRSVILATAALKCRTATIANAAQPAIGDGHCHEQNGTLNRGLFWAEHTITTFELAKSLGHGRARSGGEPPPGVDDAPRVERLAHVLQRVVRDTHQPHPKRDGRIPAPVHDAVEVRFGQSAEVVGVRPSTASWYSTRSAALTGSNAATCSAV